MFKFKLSFSSFRLCRRRKNKSPASTHFFSPFNPKALEITYPTIPSPPPTTPTHHPSPLATTPELLDSPVKNFGDRKTIKKDMKKKTNMGSSDESVDSLKKVGFGDTLTGGCGDGYCNVMKETLTVVKWSERPYDDFKGSMLEMILEKEMFEVKDLEELLQCFLSINSRHHHANIVAAFTEIWELLFL